jgi:hypothetical protein
MAWRLFLVLFAYTLISFLLIEPLARGWWLRHELLTALDHASSVRVVEHSFFTDTHFVDPSRKEVTYATKTLTPNQIESLREALPIRLDYSGSIMLSCAFEEHHYIEIRRQDGSILTLHICFHCGEIELDQQDQRLMPWGWYSSLSRFISSLGLHPHGPWDTNPDAAK